jgi:phosphoglycerate kinase
MEFKSIHDLDLKGKIVILRADLNVPTKNNEVTDFNRIDRLKPTIDYLIKNNARIVILSHFGRPKGEKKPEYSMKFLVPSLSSRWDTSVLFSESCAGSQAAENVAKLKDGQVMLLENTRFHKEEELNDLDFAQDLASLGDIFVNDAFSTSHRAHASTEGIAHFLPTYAGFLLKDELNALSSALTSPKRPLAAIVGGAKISTKLDLLSNLVEKTDMLVLGGGMANTFLSSQGFDLKSSLSELDMLTTAQQIIEKAAENDCEILMPVDAICSTGLEDTANVMHCDIHSIPDNFMVLDIGPQTVEMLTGKLQTCSTVVWNGPLGAFEFKPFDQGTNVIAQCVAQLTSNHSLLSVAGGGDTVSALSNANALNDFSYVSTAGGAFLEWLEGKTLPGIAALTAYQQAA